MEFSEVVSRRRMVRNFSEEPVETAVIERMLDMARRAPSAGFTQGQSFVVVTGAETRKAVGRLCGEASYEDAGFGRWISKAPVLVIPCTSERAYHKRYQEADKTVDGEEIVWPVPFWFMDIGCSVMTLLLAVVDEGLAAGFAGCPDMAGLSALLHLPDYVTPVGAIPIGHPVADQRSPSLRRGRKPLADVVHYESW